MSYYERDEALSTAINTLQDIADWRMPCVVYKSRQITTYGAANGSNGERDYFRDKAAHAIEQIRETFAKERKAFYVYVDGEIKATTDWYDVAKNVIDSYKDTKRNIEVLDGYGNHRQELEDYANES